MLIINVMFSNGLLQFDWIILTLTAGTHFIFLNNGAINNGRLHNCLTPFLFNG